MNRTAIKRAACCGDKPCIWPHNCYAKRRGCKIEVDLDEMADAVLALEKRFVQAVYQGGPIHPLSGKAE